MGGVNTAEQRELFPRPTLDEAWVLVERFPIGVRFNLKHLKCGRSCCRGRDTRGHGPYWFAFWKAGGKCFKVYVGSQARRSLIEAAWEVVGEELAKAANTPAVRRLRALEERAGATRGTRRVPARADRRLVEVPIYDGGPEVK